MVQRHTQLHVLQVNGKMRGTIEVENDVEQQSAQEAALGVPNIAKFVDGKPMKKVIWVPGKIMNFIIGK